MRQASATEAAAVGLALGIAGGRTLLGVVATTAPRVPGRFWLGAEADRPGARVFARALGGRDLALGLGAWEALTAPTGEPGGRRRDAAIWVAMGGLADTVDLAATCVSWRKLPRRNRWAVAAVAGGSAALSLALASYLWRSQG